MRGLVASLFLLSAVLPEAAATAQFVGRHDYGPVGVSDPFVGEGRRRGPGLGRELHNIRERIHNERGAGILSKSQARRLRQEAKLIADLAARDEQQGMSQSAQDELEARVHYLSDAVGLPR